jgi:hypothetical protein
MRKKIHHNFLKEAHVAIYIISLFDNSENGKMKMKKITFIILFFLHSTYKIKF